MREKVVVQETMMINTKEVHNRNSMGDLGIMKSPITVLESETIWVH